MARPKRKPHDPARAERDELQRQAERQRARRAEDARMRDEGIDPRIARWGDEGITRERQAELEAKDVELTLDHRRRVVRAKRLDLFAQLHARGGLNDEQLEAVRDLQQLMAMRAGLAGRNEDADYADMQVDRCRDACPLTQAMIDAGKKVDLTLMLVGPPSSRILQKLIEPGVRAAEFDWHEAVERLTGEARIETHGALVRSAAQALVDVRPRVEHLLGLKQAVEGKGKDRDHPFLGMHAAIEEALA